MAGSPEYLTAVSLHFLEGERNYRLLFGNPVKITTKGQRYGETQETAFFRPGSIFAVDLWDRNKYGTRRWRVLILKAGNVGETVERVPQISPGAHKLLDTQGTFRCKLLLQWLRMVEAEGDPADRPPEFYIVRDHMLKGLPPRMLNTHMLNHLQDRVQHA